MESSDLEVIDRVRGGDHDVFRLLVCRHSRSVFRLAYRMTGNEADAEDVVQETFLRAFRQLATYESRSSFSTWLHRIAANYTLDLLRVRQRTLQRQAIPRMEEEESDPMEAIRSNEPAPDRALYSAQVRQRLEAAMRELSQQERTAFVLRHYEGMSIEQIGSALAIGESATKNSIFRAVRKLREALQPVVSAV